jgi:hypothetical protein
LLLPARENLEEASDREAVYAWTSKDLASCFALVTVIAVRIMMRVVVYIMMMVVVVVMIIVAVMVAVMMMRLVVLIRESKYPACPRLQHPASRLVNSRYRNMIPASKFIF